MRVFAFRVICFLGSFQGGWFIESDSSDELQVFLIERVESHIIYWYRLPKGRVLTLFTDNEQSDIMTMQVEIPHGPRPKPSQVAARQEAILHQEVPQPVQVS
jgi:hypothetical protein